MKTESNIYPEKITVERYDGKSDIILTENVAEINRTDMNGEESTVYQYDSYRVTVTDRTNLETSVADNFEQWLAFAKSEPLKAPTVDERVGSLEVATDGILTVLEAIV